MEFEECGVCQTWDCRWAFKPLASIVGQSQRSSSVVHFGRRFGTEHGVAANRGCHTIERMTALSKPDGGVRGIVTGNVWRRWVAQTMAQQSIPVRPLNPCRVRMHCCTASFERNGTKHRGKPTVVYRQYVHGAPSSFLWEDSSGVPPRRMRRTRRSTFLFSLGQHSALEAVQEDLFDCEFFFRLLG